MLNYEKVKNRSQEYEAFFSEMTKTEIDELKVTDAYMGMQNGFMFLIMTFKSGMSKFVL